MAIKAFGIGTLTAPVSRLIAAGTPMIDMDTLIAQLGEINVHVFIAPDNEFMGASVTQAWVDAIGGEATMIMTQGALGHTGAPADLNQWSRKSRKSKRTTRNLPIDTLPRSPASGRRC